MNRLERDYSVLLEMRRAAGEIALWMYEGVTLKLAKDTRYTPDFMVMMPDGQIEMHEVKGFWQDDARVKIKVAAGAFPFAFFGVTREGREWKYESFSD